MARWGSKKSTCPLAAGGRCGMVTGVGARRDSRTSDGEQEFYGHAPQAATGWFVQPVSMISTWPLPPEL